MWGEGRNLFQDPRACFQAGRSDLVGGRNQCCRTDGTQSRRGHRDVLQGRALWETEHLKWSKDEEALIKGLFINMWAGHRESTEDKCSALGLRS